jgi:putative transposase
MAVLGNVDAYKNAGIRGMLGFGHSRVSSVCGSQNHHRDLSPGYGRLLRKLWAAQAAITFNGASFPICYGTEFTSNAILEREDRGEVALHRPRQADARHGTCGAFNGRKRDELLNETLFFGIDHAREAVAEWAHTYNTERPHSALEYQAPESFAAQLTAMGDQLRAPETLRRSPIAPSAQPRQIQTPTLASIG